MCFKTTVFVYNAVPPWKATDFTGPFRNTVVHTDFSFQFILQGIAKKTFGTISTFKWTAKLCDK